jgi:thiol-disulfide isomerase/thioredoxin
VVELTPENFAAEVEGAGAGRVFVEFYAPWCPFCQRLEPTWNELPNRLKEKGVDTKIARMNVDTYTDYGERFGVTGFPTLMLFRDGRPVGQKTGLTDMATLMKYAGYQETSPLGLGGSKAEMNLVLGGDQVASAADELNELRRMINGEVDGDKAAALAHIDAVERLFAKRAL